MIIKNCIITKSDSTILKDWSISGKDIHTGVDISAHNVYSPCYGVVVQILNSMHDNKIVVIQYNESTCIRYANLSSVEVKINQSVVEGELIGRCTKYVHVELLSTTIDQNLLDQIIYKLPVRVKSKTYFRIAPTDLVMGKMEFPLSGITQMTFINPTTPLPKLENISNEFGDNR